MTFMDQKTIEKLEGKTEEAIAEIIVKMGLKKLSLLAARHTMHLMAKALVAVYAPLFPCSLIKDALPASR